MREKILVIGGGVAGANFAVKLVDNGYPGNLITIVDKGKDPYERKPEETMTGWLGAGGWSDGKLVISVHQGGQLSKYCGDEKAIELMEEVVTNFKRFHPKPGEIYLSDPKEEPDFIKPYFTLRMSPVYHIGSNYLHDIAKNWYEYLVDKGVNFEWGVEVTDVDFAKKQACSCKKIYDYDKLLFAVGKSGIGFSSELIKKYNLSTEKKNAQLGVRFECPQKYFQKIIDISYDFKLYRNHGSDVSIRSFCTNNNAAYVAVEETYGDISYNGHAKKGEEFKNNMTNFGILMEIKGIPNPFDWSRKVVSRCNILPTNGSQNFNYNRGIYYSPNQTRRPSQTSEGKHIQCVEINELDLGIVKDAFDGYFSYIEKFIEDMNKIFNFGDDYGIYIPEVKYTTPEPATNHNDLSLIEFPNVYFVGDALSARGISVAGSHGLIVAESMLK